MSISFAEPLYALIDETLKQAIDPDNADDLQMIAEALARVVGFATAFDTGGVQVLIGAAGNVGGIVNLGWADLLLEFAKRMYNLVTRGVPDEVLNKFSLPFFPASHDSVWGVGAVGASREPAKYSMLADVGFPPNPMPGIWAFGGDMANGKGMIGQAGPGRFVSWEGTSFAAAVVTGVQALLFAQNPASGTVPVGTATAVTLDSLVTDLEDEIDGVKYVIGKRLPVTQQ